MFLAVALAGPAGAGKIFTVDFNNNDINDTDGSDDLYFSFNGSSGFVDGYIRAVNINQFGANVIALQNTVDVYDDFTGSTPLDFPNMDILVFDVVVQTGIVDEVGVSVATDPSLIDPVGAGYFDPCTGAGTPIGCVSNGNDPTTGNQETDPSGVAGISLQPGVSNIFGVFPGAGIFDFDSTCPSLPCPGWLTAGEGTRRLFIAYNDTGPQSPLTKNNQKAKFMISSGINQDFEVDIVPEPNTAVLVGLGLVMLGVGRARRRGRA